jgi:hypothetical protein
MTQNGPRVIFPLERIVSKEQVKKEDVSSTKELKEILLKHIDERFKTIEEKIKNISKSGPALDLPKLETEIRANLKEEIKTFICSDCIKPGQYELDKQAFNDLLEKYKLNPMRIVETLYQAADIKIGKEDGLTLSDKLQIIKNG